MAKKKESAGKAFLSKKRDTTRPKAPRKPKLPKKFQPRKNEFEDPLSFCSTKAGFNPDMTFDSRRDANGKLILSNPRPDF